MKRILYFDMWSPVGHHVFNNIHLKALSQLGEVYTIFKEGYYKFDFPHVHHFLDVPKSFYKEGEGYYKSRLRLAKVVKWVWGKIYKEQWDYIILSSYDPFALYISQRFKDSIVIDHNTLGLIDSKIHGFPLCHLSKRMKHLVFSNGMRERLIECGIKNVSIVPHGFLPMEIEMLSNYDENELLQRYSLNPLDRIIFFPSLSKAADDLFLREFYNPEFNEFLKQHGLKILAKSSIKGSPLSNFSIINGYLPDNDYKYLFLHSSCNVLLYISDFRYRASGVLNECFANNIPCVISDNTSLKEYLPFINNGSCVFQNAEELKSSILSVLNRNGEDYYRNLEIIRDPRNAWEEILS